MTAIFKREFTSYFRSPVGWAALAFVQLLGGIYFSSYMQLQGIVSIGGEISLLSASLIIVIPIITMRLFSEERKNGTEVLLITSSVPLYKIVLGKYLAALSLIGIMILSTILHVILVLYMGGHIDWGTLGSYISFFLLASVFLAAGEMTSSLSENQIAAAGISFVIVLFSLLLNTIASAMENIFISTVSSVNFLHLSTESINKAGENLAAAVNWMDPYLRTGNYAYGIISVGPFVFCLSLTAVFLFITYRNLEKRRWSQG